MPYGAVLNIKPDEAIKAGADPGALGTLRPTRPIITEYAGTAKFENIEEGLTVAKQVDDVTGLSTLVVIDPKRRGSTKVVRPLLVRLIDADGQEVKIPGTELPVAIGFQVGALIQVRDGQEVGPGEALARIPVEGQKTRDITGGLPRVAELFEARTPKDKGTLAEQTGTVSFGKETKGKVRLQITDPDGHVWEELIPKEKNALVHEGQVVNKGEHIVDGPADPQDILRLLGIEELARYIVDEVEDAYRLQGVKINDKHIEVIVRQMLRRVVVENPGETSYIQGEQVERSEILKHQRGHPARRQDPRDLLQHPAGHYQGAAVHRQARSRPHPSRKPPACSPRRPSWASDELRGLKENVIVGRLILPVRAWLTTRPAKPRTKWTRPSAAPLPKPKRPSWPPSPRRTTCKTRLNKRRNPWRHKHGACACCWPQKPRAVHRPPPPEGHCWGIFFTAHNAVP